MTVQIHPLLSAHLVGPPVVGSPLAVTVRVQPETAGPIHVSATRNGHSVSRRLVYGAGRIGLATSSFGQLEIRVETLARPGYAAVTRELRAALRPPVLAYGGSGPAVAQLLRGLAALHYAVPALQASFDDGAPGECLRLPEGPGTAADGSRRRRLLGRDSDEPAGAQGSLPQPASHIEVTRRSRSSYVVRDGEIVLISPVSTAGIAGYYTPVGRFAIFRKVPGYDPSPLGVLYKPMYFYGGYAIHGNPSVPPYPASHGCIRVPNFVIERLYSSEPYGETVYVYAGPFGGASSPRPRRRTRRGCARGTS